MARSLPENTVDAWTAIALARQGADWIWLPTANQGATRTGSHPGDISAMYNRRLVVIENKGIEDHDHIDLGDDWSAQLGNLRVFEELGLRLARQAIGPLGCPPLGWVFYGLPLLAGPVDGSRWSDFETHHHLICPHDLQSLGQRSSALSAYARTAFSKTQIDHADGLAMVPRFAQPPRLDRLSAEIRFGRVGLPIWAWPVDIRPVIGSLARAAQRIVEVSTADRDPAEEVQEWTMDERDRERELTDLLADLSVAAGGLGANVSVVAV